MILTGMCYVSAIAQDEITWLDQVRVLPGPAKYGRMVMMKQGPKAGQILLTYQQYDHGRKIVKRYSLDQGYTWSSESTVLQKSGNWTYANCNIIELQDGRLLMTYQKRHDSDPEGYTGKNRYICVKYSSDGGNSWTAEEDVFQGGNWEPMPIQLTSGDIYIFFTLQDIYPTYYTEEQCIQANEIGGRAVAFIASHDSGMSWTNYSNERYGARMLLRDYNESTSSDNFSGSGGGMPTPFVTGEGRLGFIAESIDRKNSPWIVVAPQSDYTFRFNYFQGDWQTVNYDGTGDNKVYPESSSVRWALQTNHFGGAPFALKLSNGKIAFSYNNDKKIRCWVANSNAKNGVEQKRPFGNDDLSFYSAMINVNDSTVLMVAHDPADDDDANLSGKRRLYLRHGRVKDYVVTTSTPQINSDQYNLYAVGNEVFIYNLTGTETIRIYNMTGRLINTVATEQGETVIRIPDSGVYIVQILIPNQNAIVKKIAIK